MAVAQKIPEFHNGLPWEVETRTKTCGLPLLFNFEPHPYVKHGKEEVKQIAQGESPSPVSNPNRLDCEFVNFSNKRRQNKDHAKNVTSHCDIVVVGAEKTQLPRLSKTC